MDGLIILGDMTKPYIEKIEKEGGVPVVCLDFITMPLVWTQLFPIVLRHLCTDELSFSMGHTKLPM